MASYGRKLLLGGFLSLSMLFGSKAKAQTTTPEDSVRHARVNTELIDEARQGFRRLVALGETGYSKELDSLGRLFTRRLLMSDTSIVSQVVFLDGNRLAVAGALGATRDEAIDSLFSIQGVPPFQNAENRKYILDAMTELHYSPYGPVTFTQDPYTITLKDVKTSVVTALSDHAVHPSFRNKYISHTMNTMLVNLHEGWHALHSRYSRQMMAQDTTKLQGVDWSNDATVADNPTAVERAAIFARREIFADLGAVSDMVKVGFSTDVVLRHARWRESSDALHMTAFALEALAQHIDSVGIDKFRAMPHLDVVELCYKLADSHSLNDRGWQYMFSNSMQRLAMVEKYGNDPDIAMAIRFEGRMADGRDGLRHFPQEVNMEVMQKLNAMPGPLDEMAQRAFRDHGIVTPETMIAAYRDIMDGLRAGMMKDPNNPLYTERMTIVRLALFRQMTDMDFVATNKTFGRDISDMMMKSEKKKFADNAITDLILAYPQSADAAKNVYSALLDSLEAHLNSDIVPVSGLNLTKVAVMDPIVLDVALALGIKPQPAVEMMLRQDSVSLGPFLPHYVRQQMMQSATPDSIRTQAPTLIYNQRNKNPQPAVLIPFDPAVANDIGDLTQAEERIFVNHHESWHLRDGGGKLKKEEWDAIDLIGLPGFRAAGSMPLALRFYSSVNVMESLADVGAAGDMIREGHDMRIVRAVSKWRSSMPSSSLSSNVTHLSTACLNALEGKILDMGVERFRKLDDKAAQEIYIGIVEKHAQTPKSLAKGLSHFEAKLPGKIARTATALFSRDQRKGLSLARHIAIHNNNTLQIPQSPQPDAWDPLRALLDRAFCDSRIVTPETVIKAYGKLQGELMQAAENDNKNRALYNDRMLRMRKAFIDNLRILPYADINLERGLKRGDMQSRAQKRNTP